MNTPQPLRFPDRYIEREFYPFAYHYMYLARTFDNSISDLFRKGLVKGTATLGFGNEATSVGMSLPLRPGVDVVSLLHRDVGAHMVLGNDLYKMFCQYMANADSITHGREGNVHHGNVAQRRFPMISHLGNMLGTVVGGVMAARKNAEEVFGLAILGDGGSSTGDVHESINFASVQKIPVLFVIQNNLWAYSTPAAMQYNCARLSDRAAGYGITGRTIDGTDSWAVYSAVCEALDEMRRTGNPFLLECMTVRLGGHAPYDKAEYYTDDYWAEIRSRDPLPRVRTALAEKSGYSEERIREIERHIDEGIAEVIPRALGVPRPDPHKQNWAIYAPPKTLQVEPYSNPEVRTTNLAAVTLALDYILAHEPRAFIMGQDIGNYGSAFKTCKGLYEKFGPGRVMDTPLCESATTAVSLGASQTGGRPIMEFQFADFSTEAVTALGLNTSTWYFRSGSPAQVLMRLPCGGGITLGAFHSGEFDGLWSRFPGLKILYPVSPQEMFEALVAGFHDPNPCLVMEHKLLYSRARGPINFTGNLLEIWKARRYTEGSDITIVATGAMVAASLEAVEAGGFSAEVWNPFVLYPLDIDPVVESVQRTGRLLVVQESGHTAGSGDRIVSLVCQRAFAALKSPPELIAGPDAPVPFAPELEVWSRPDVNMIRTTLQRILGERR